MIEVYGPEMEDRIRLLESLGVRLMYNVDGTKLSKGTFDEGKESTHALFHRIVWNFPCSAIQKGQDGQNKEMEFNKTLIREFVAGAMSLLDEAEGQIHINHKTPT